MKSIYGDLRTMKTLRFMFFLIALSSLNLAGAQSLLNKMFELVVAGAECKQDLNNWLNCNYKVGQNLKFSIKDAGGSDQVISFNHSDINDDYAAVMYFGCIVVIPGHATKNHGKDDNVYVSPKNGRVYQTRQECQSAKQ